MISVDSGGRATARMAPTYIIDSPVGPLGIKADAASLVEIRFHAAGPRSPAPPNDLAAETARQLDQYFAGRRERFDLPVSPTGTAFQRTVWDALTRIAYGETLSYGELAARIGRPAAVRAVGAANGRNPIPIVIPCHRVIGHNGKLVGFGGGLDAKRFLLRLEQAALFR